MRFLFSVNKKKKVKPEPRCCNDGKYFTHKIRSRYVVKTRCLLTDLFHVMPLWARHWQVGGRGQGQCLGAPRYSRRGQQQNQWWQPFPPPLPGSSKENQAEHGGVAVSTAVVLPNSWSAPRPAYQTAVRHREAPGNQKRPNEQLIGAGNLHGAGSL